MAQIKDFLHPDHPTIPLTTSLEEVAERFLHVASPDRAKEVADCIVVLGSDDRPVGLINASLLLAAVATGAKKEDEPAVDSLMKDRFQLPVSVAMAEDFPVVAPDDELFSVLTVLGKSYFECLPVMKGDQYLGAVRTIDLFQAIADEVLGAASGGLFTEL